MKGGFRGKLHLKLHLNTSHPGGYFLVLFFSETGQGGSGKGWH